MKKYFNMYNLINGFNGKELINVECGQRPILYNKEYYVIRRFLNILDCYLMDYCQSNKLGHVINSIETKMDFVIIFNASKKFSIDCKCDKISNEISEYFLSNLFFKSMTKHSRLSNFRNNAFTPINVPNVSISLFDIEDEMQLENFYMDLNNIAENLALDLININNHIKIWKELYKE